MSLFRGANSMISLKMWCVLLGLFMWRNILLIVVCMFGLVSGLVCIVLVRCLVFGVCVLCSRSASRCSFSSKLFGYCYVSCCRVCIFVVLLGVWLRICLMSF